MAGTRWLPWDVGYYNNPKARAAGKNGRALHHASSCWAADNMTDGIVRPTDVALLCALAEVPRSTVMVLEREELWEPLPVEALPNEPGPGWYIHDFLVHNKSREAIEEQRREWSEKKRGQRHVSPGDTHGESPEIPAIRQTDRQTHRSAQVSDDDDYSDSGHRSSSSEEIIATTAKAIALKAQDNPSSGYVIGIAKNLRAEQMPTITACASEGLTLYDSMLRLGADPWFAKKALEGSAK